MATSTLCQSSPLGSTAGNSRLCMYLPRQQTFQPKADWRASFIDTTRESYQSLQTKPLILRQQNGVWSQSSNATMNNSPDLQPETESLPANLPPKSMLSLGRIPKTLRCHVCQANIREEYFQDHLFFGTVRCDLCGFFCGTCRNFQHSRTAAEKGRSSCRHIYLYTEDPFEFVLPRLSGSDDMHAGGSVSLPNKFRVLQNYINQLTSLHLREPWCNGIRKCKSMLIKAQIAMPMDPSENVELQENSPTTGAGGFIDEDYSRGSSLSSNESNLCDNSLMAVPERVVCASPVQRDSQEDEIDDGLLLTQTYDLEHLDQEVEYVDLEDQIRLGIAERPVNQQVKTKKKRKLDPYKKLKAHRLNTSQRKKRHTIPSTSADEMDDEESLVMEEVALPESGYYLMIREAVEECPMCYEFLYPSQCSVNLKTFLFTMSCTNCGLLIYIVPDLPDGLKIVTGNDGGGMISRTTPIKSNKTQKIRPRDFFAR